MIAAILAFVYLVGVFLYFLHHIYRTKVDIQERVKEWGKTGQCNFKQPIYPYEIQISSHDQLQKHIEENFWKIVFQEISDMHIFVMTFWPIALLIWLTMVLPLQKIKKSFVTSINNDISDIHVVKDIIT